MMNPQAYGDRSGGVKWIVGFLLVLMAGTILLVFVASGTLNPKTAADARRTDAETEIFVAQSKLDQARAEIDLDTYQKQQAILLEFERQQRAQQLAQEAEDFQRMEAQKEWAIRLLAVATSLTFLLAAGAFAYRQYAQSRAAKRAETMQRYGRELYGLLSDLKARFQQLETESAAERFELQRLINTLQKQVATLQAEILNLESQNEPSPNGENGQAKSPILFPTTYRPRKNVN